MQRALELSSKKTHLPPEYQNYDPMVPYLAPYMEEAKYQLQVGTAWRKPKFPEYLHGGSRNSHAYLSPSICMEEAEISVAGRTRIFPPSIGATISSIGTTSSLHMSISRPTWKRPSINCR